MIGEFLQQEIYGNRISEYLICLAIIVGGILLVWIVEALLLRRLKAWAGKTASTWDDFLVDRIRRTGIPLAYLVIVQAALRVLTLTPRVERIVDVAGIVLLALLGVVFTVSLVQYGFEQYIRKQGEDASRDRALKGVVNLAKSLVWITGGLFLLDNLGFRISTVIAGLGIGGIAVALAAQAILGDLFGYFVILFDRPFEIGDFIVVGDHMGTIERFGIKTTRIASLNGEQIVFSNKDLTDSRVRNYKRMAKRRVAFRLGVTYQTPVDRLREIPGIVADVFREIEGATLDRVHFFSYGDFSLVHEVVYYVDGNDYTRYMDI
ncbi:MAG TPA: mechanosensitive ion channel family protein, partial [Candidatus Deferrimicrobium sp.]|nr:mechanosensitive ion channel family protein [Candidatus Deferrimicrobium sp.]